MAKPRTFSLLFAAVTVFSSLLTAQGELLVYEPFDYPDGVALFGQGSWSGHDPGMGTTIDANGLTFPGLETSGGKAVMAGGTNNHIKIDNADVPAAVAAGWDQLDGGTFYMSYLIEGPHMDLWHNPFSAGGITQIRGSEVKVTNSPDAAPSSAIVNTNIPDGLKYIAYRMTMPTSDGDPGSHELVVDPDLSLDEDAIFAGAPITNAFSISGDDALIQFSRKPGEGETAIDEFRFATTWAEASGGTAGPPPTDFTWRSDASGDWNVRGNWSPSGVPNGITGGANPGPADETATFGDAITTSQTVFTNTDVKVASVTFDNASSSYIIAGAGSVTLQADSGSTNLTVSQGSHEFQARVGVGANTTADVASGAAIAFNHTLSLNGNTLIKTGDGTLSINNNLETGGSGSVDCQAGTCNGTGTIGGDLDSSGGVVAPGNSPGILSVDGNFTQSAGGTLEIELASNGGVAGTDHDRLAVTLAASLDGTLDMQLDGGYSPTIGDSFAGIVTAGTVSGSFATTNNVVIDGRRGVAVTYTETAVNAQIGLRGNTDIASGDIDVDTSDLTTSIINFTSAGGTGKTWADGDMDGDGDVDTSDLTTSIINFTSALGSAQSVPEPGSSLLLFVAMTMMVVCRRRS